MPVIWVSNVAINKFYDKKTKPPTPDHSETTENQQVACGHCGYIVPFTPMVCPQCSTLVDNPQIEKYLQQD